MNIYMNIYFDNHFYLYTIFYYKMVLIFLLNKKKSKYLTKNNLLISINVIKVNLLSISLV